MHLSNIVEVKRQVGITRKSKNRLVLRAVDADDARRGGLRGNSQLSGGRNGKIYGKGMNAARQRLRRMCRTTGVRRRNIFTPTYSLGSDPLYSVCVGDRTVLRVEDGDGGGGLTAMEMVKYTAVETRT